MITVYCLSCHQLIEHGLSWQTILPKLDPICPDCAQLLAPIHLPTCDYCGRDDHISCLDCKRWRPSQLLCYNRSVFRYNTFLKEVIARWKFRGDYQLYALFVHSFQARFNQYFSELPKHTWLVPIPLSEKRLAHRSFNQAEALASLLPRTTVPLLKRLEGEKQSKKTRKHRLAMRNPFLYQGSQEDVDFAQPIVLIDDIYTTGTTIHHAAQRLRAAGHQKVYSFTLAR